MAATEAAPATAEAQIAPSAAAAKVSANDASVEELAAAFTAAGIPNADKWAREVDEYRPYDTSDPTFAHLRDELAKYNPAPEVVEQIIAALSL